jgi:hypothetical protein
MFVSLLAVPLAPLFYLERKTKLICNLTVTFIGFAAGELYQTFKYRGSRCVYLPYYHYPMEMEISYWEGYPPNELVER